MAILNSPSQFCIFISASSNRGAISQQSRAIAQDLVNRGHQVVILIDHKKTKYSSPDSNPAYYTWPSSRPTHIQDAWFLQNLLWKYHPHCMISQFGSENLFLTLGWLNQIPCRITWYHSILEKPKDMTLYNQLSRIYFVWRKRIILSLASMIIGVSEAAGADANQIFGVPQKKIVTIHNSIKDPLPSHPEKLMDTKPDKKRITCVSALIEAKGQETLLNAISLVRQDFPAVIVDFVGSGKSIDMYQKLSQSLNVEENCVFSGLIPYEDVLRRMQNSWLTVFPTRSEAFGLVALESLAVGTPVIASNIGGLPEIIQDGVEGFLFPVGDHKILAEKILILLSDEDLRTKMAQNARKKYIKEFNLEETSKFSAIKIENIINDSLTKQERLYFLI